MEHAGVYHRNRRFILLVILLLIILMAVFNSTREGNPIFRSPQEENTFVSSLVPGETCKCVYINAEFAQLAQQNLIAITSIDHPTSAECLVQSPCTIQINLKTGNFWEPQTIIGTSAYAA